LHRRKGVEATLRCANPLDDFIWRYAALNHRENIGVAQDSGALGTGICLCETGNNIR
jgi:hypothetical protein